jgi:hypothetical protein
MTPFLGFCYVFSVEKIDKNSDLKAAEEKKGSVPMIRSNDGSISRNRSPGLNKTWLQAFGETVAPFREHRSNFSDSMPFASL